MKTCLQANTSMTRKAIMDTPDTTTLNGEKDRRKFLLFGDVHYAGPQESARGLTETEIDVSLLQKSMVMFYRKFLWLADPIAHAHQFGRLLEKMELIKADEAICLGDLSMDTAFVGLSDPATLESAKAMMAMATESLSAPLTWLMGDHELGKTSMIGKRGGPRIKSLQLWEKNLGLPVHWHYSWEGWRFIGVCSTLAGYQVYAPEFPEPERDEWDRAEANHRQWMRETFTSVQPDERIILFCHDPSALGFMAQIPEIREKMPQIATTWVGHMHSSLVERAGVLLSGIPPIHSMGTSIRRFSVALQKAKVWPQFRMKLCPSPSGSELLRDGGFYEMILHADPARSTPCCIFHPNPW